MCLHLSDLGRRHSLFALVSVGLRHRLRQLHLKLVAAQRHLLVVGDEGEERVEHQVVGQVELGAARLLPGVDPTVLHTTRTPAETGRQTT